MQAASRAILPGLLVKHQSYGQATPSSTTLAQICVQRRAKCVVASRWSVPCVFVYVFVYVPYVCMYMFLYAFILACTYIQTRLTATCSARRRSKSKAPNSKAKRIRNSMP